MNTTRNVLVTLTIAATAGLASTTALTSASAAPAPQSATQSGSTKGQSPSVPWDEVGPGWSAHSVMNNGGPDLVLTSPQGDSYYIKTLEAGERVVAIADDGASVVTERESKPGRIHHLTSGEVTTVASMGRILGYLPGNASVVGYETDTNDLVTYDAQTGGAPSARPSAATSLR